MRTLQERGGVRGGTWQAVGQQGRGHCRGEGGCQRGDMAGHRAAEGVTVGGGWRVETSEGGHRREKG